MHNDKKPMTQERWQQLAGRLEQHSKSHLALRQLATYAVQHLTGEELEALQKQHHNHRHRIASYRARDTVQELQDVFT